MKQDLLRFKSKQKYILFDFETCSLNLGSLDNKPWQLSYLIAEGNKIKEKKDFFLLWDDLKLSEDARRITRFNDKKYLKSAVPPEFVLKEFESYIYNEEYKVVGHNILGFDVYVHGILRRLCGLKPDFSYIKRCIDTNCIAKAIKNQISFSQEDKFYNWQYKLQNERFKGVRTNLKQLCKDYDVEFDEGKLHDALYDIEVNFKVFNKQLWDIEV
tara:strand:- start:991 stop:1632 length:642 start_codon:yes stop_codon:yes gene_type:complete